MSDERMYAAAEEFFSYIRSKVRGLESLQVALREQQETLQAMRPYGGGAPGGAASDPTAQAALRIQEGCERLAEAIADVERLRALAEQAIDGMQRAGADADLDAGALRLYYLTAMPTGDAARALGYNPKYFADKRELALIHVAPFVPLSW